jgi:hypothetical protein
MDPKRGVLIRVTYCLNSTTRPEYVNLVHGSIHSIVQPPKFKRNTDWLVWVRGVGRKVCLLKWEFEYVKKRTKF